jgi:hypothetical protein
MLPLKNRCEVSASNENTYLILKIVLKATSQFRFRLSFSSLVDFLLHVLGSFQKKFSESQADFENLFRVLGGYLFAPKRFVGKVFGRIFIIVK